MADNQLEFNVSVESQEIERLRKEIDSLETQAKRAAEKVGAKWSKVGRNMSSLGDGLTKGVTVPLLAAGGFALKTAIDFESAFAGVIKTVDATDAELGVLRQGIIDMATEIPATREEIAGVAEAAGQLGIETGSILEFTRVMIDLGEATNLSGQEAATALARFANITQMSQEDFGRLGSTVVDLGNNMATTEAEIVQMALRLAGAGEQVGMTEAEILAMAAALSSVGIEAEAGGSATSKVLVEMANAAASGGDKLKDFADVAGVSIGEFKEMFEEDAAGALIAFTKGLQRVSDEGGNVFGVLEDMGITEIRMRDALLRAAGAGDLFAEALEVGSKAWEENNALTKEAEQRYGTTASQLEILRNRASGAALEFGEALVPALLDALDALEPVLNLITDTAESFSELDGGTQKAIIGFLAFTAGVGPVLSVTGRLTTGVANLATNFVSLQRQMSSGASVMNTLSSSAGGLGIAMTGAALGVGYAIGEMINGIPAVKEFQATVADFVVDTFELGQASVELGPKMAGAFDEYGRPLTETAQAFADVAAATRDATSAIDAYQGQVAGIKDATLAKRQADLDVTRSQQDLTQAIQDFGQNSPEAEQASIHLEQALLRQEEAAARVTEKTDEMSLALKNIPMPSGSNAEAWADYYATLTEAASRYGLAARSAAPSLIRRSSGGSFTSDIQGHEAGTVTSGPEHALIGENGQEAVINLTNPRYLDRSRDILDYAADRLGAGGITVAIGTIYAPGGDVNAVREAARIGSESGVTNAVRRQRGHRGLIGYTN